MTRSLPSLGIGPHVDRAVKRLTDELGERARELGASLDVDGYGTLRERARLLGFDEPTTTSSNGQSRLIRCRDKWIALSLARADDVDLLAALLQRPVGDDPWGSVTSCAGQIGADELVARGRLLGLPIAVVARDSESHGAPITLRRRSGATPRRTLRGLAVADLSSLWAGPLTAKILADAGATVTKIESSTRPDGARARPEFYSTFHDPHQRSLVVDFTNERDLQALGRTLEEADVVIEASRPRALVQLGLGPDTLTARPGTVWLSITGYGRQPPGDGWVAFGDDGAAAGGLVDWSNDEEPRFIGDAIADPITGLFGALGVIESLNRGGGDLVEVSLQRSASWVSANGTRPFVDERTD